MVRMLAVFLAVLSAVHGARAAEGVTLIGPGARSCADFNEDYETGGKQAEDVYFAWAQGYLVGFNERRDRFYHLYAREFDTGMQRSFIRRDCLNHPGQDYIEAVRNLYTRIAAANVAENR